MTTSRCVLKNKKITEKCFRCQNPKSLWTYFGYSY
jgi:hypothetical protein